MEGTTEVRRSPAQSRYELFVDGRLVGVADYFERSDGVVFPHTEIDPALRGQGLGELLIRGALDDVRASGGHVVPLCWFVADFIAANEDYRDLLAA
jgi:predicted GNAT family acetyltransferase